MSRKTTIFGASGDANTQWRRIAKPPNTTLNTQRNGGCSVEPTAAGHLTQAGIDEF